MLQEKTKSPKNMLQEKAISIISNNEEFKEEELCKLMEQGLNIHRPINDETGDMLIHIFVCALFKYNIGSNTCRTIEEKVILQKIKFLVRNEVDFNIYNNEGITAIFHLLTGYSQYNFSRRAYGIHLLLSCGISLDNYIFDSYNQSIIEYLEHDMSMGYYKYYVESYVDSVISCISTNNIIHTVIIGDVFTFKYSITINHNIFKNNMLVFINDRVGIRAICDYYNSKTNRFNFDKCVTLIIDYCNIDIEERNYSYRLLNPFVPLLNQPEEIVLTEKIQQKIKLYNDSIDYWKPSTHYIKCNSVRCGVWCLLLVSERRHILDMNNLPPEIWLHVCSFLNDDMWKTVINGVIVQQHIKLDDLPCCM
jgi:hypothetical protein